MSLFQTTSFVTGGQRRSHHQFQAGPWYREFQASPAYTVRAPYTNYTCIKDVCVNTANICVTVFTINS